MKYTSMIVLLMGVTLGFAKEQKPPPPPPCTDEEAMVTDYKKSLSDLVETAKKETLPEFQRAFHQKSTLTKLTLYGSMVDGLLRCLDKAVQDPATLKEHVNACKAKRETYAKLKERIQADRDALKAAETPRDAKALIEKFQSE